MPDVGEIVHFVDDDGSWYDALVQRAFINASALSVKGFASCDLVRIDAETQSVVYVSGVPHFTGTEVPRGKYWLFPWEESDSEGDHDDNG